MQYHCRPGQGRGGKTVFGAHVLHTNERTGLTDLLVIWGPEDFREMMNQRRRSDQEPFGWDYMPDARQIEIDAHVKTIVSHAQELVALREELDGLKAVVLGDYNPPERSMIDILADFEGRLKAAMKK